MEQTNYFAPEVEVIEVEVENGFTLSNGADTGMDDIPGIPD